MLRGVFLGLRGLVRSEELGPDLLGVLERLEPRRERREFVVAEVALLDAGGEDEVVVGDRGLAAIRSPGQRPDDAPDPRRSPRPWRPRRCLCFRKTSRIGAAMSPDGSIAVATW